jgi:geranylgeranyl pyrophosphate synthase
MLDEDPRGEYHRDGYAKVANYAIALQAAACEAFCSIEVPFEIRLSGLCALNQMFLMTAFGQHLDIQHIPDEDAYWMVTKNKSAPFFGAALYLGALIGGATHKTADKVEQLGRLYGEMIQIHDDLTDTMSSPASPDWLQKRSPLPILFGRVVDHPEREKFIKLGLDISAPGALLEAQDILIRCGAVSYCVDRLLRQYQVALKILNETSLVQPEILNTLLTDVITPVHKLFQKTGISLPNLITQTMVDALAE